MNSVSVQKIKADFIDQLRLSFTDLKNQPLEDILSENLISPFNVELSTDVLRQAQDIISLLFNMRENKIYHEKYQGLISKKGLKDPGNKSIAMSYDFHLDENHNLKLIEVNTNAGFMALGHEMYKAKGIQLPVPDFSLNEIAENVVSEMSLQGKSSQKDLKIAIIDKNPNEQGLFPEFLLYNELFKSRGWNSRIIDYRDLFKDFKPEFIYNRHTDFYLTDPDVSPLRQKFISGEICLSPNPFEYFMIADKQRLIDWSENGFFNQFEMTAAEKSLLENSIPRSYDVSQSNADQIWSMRKKLFFKPKNAFGSKQSYRGASISRKTFDELINGETIAQEYIPAPEVTYEAPGGTMTFKYDLRCYAYKGRLQLVVARLYQGQVTNLRTALGGFTCVKFT